jgi:hypothetical protein
MLHVSTIGGGWRWGGGGGAVAGYNYRLGSRHHHESSRSSPCFRFRIRFRFLGGASALAALPRGVFVIPFERPRHRALPLNDTNDTHDTHVYRSILSLSFQAREPV